MPSREQAGRRSSRMRGGCSQLYPRRRPDWILSAGSLRYVCISENTTRRHVNPGISRWTGGVALNNAFCFKHTPLGPRWTHPESNPSVPCIWLSMLTRLYLSGIEESRIPSSWKIGMDIFLVSWRHHSIGYHEAIWRVNERNYFYLNRYRYWYW